ncbi:unnamed protein product [Orchesella dallaii]|uniref:Uncharacterized protein n=1 Tax=Orchesella dallaii TaxID=48710 RepID=A0ABP1QIG9_9HEXA
MNFKLNIIVCVVAAFLTSNAHAKKTGAVCPQEGEQVCVTCACDSANRGFNTCEPTDSCPEPLQSTSGITMKNKACKKMFEMDYMNIIVILRHGVFFSCSHFSNLSIWSVFHGPMCPLRMFWFWC